MPGFPPLIGDDPRYLVLGSMPGVASLQQQQYYAHPRNAFWWIMGQIVGFDSTAYESRVERLTTSGIAVWDVLHDCERVGSLDSNIVRASEQPNDLESLFEQHNIRLIAFNGGTARQLFMRHCGCLLQQNPKLEWVQLPSTSPAHARLSKQEKLQIWRNAIDLDKDE